MSWKEFLKPNLRKIFLFLILGIILFNMPWFWIPACCDFTYYKGLPLAVYYWGGVTPVPETFIPSNFIVDVVFWYTFSCIIILIFKKFRKVKNK